MDVDADVDVDMDVDIDIDTPKVKPALGEDKAGAYGSSIPGATAGAQRR